MANNQTNQNKGNGQAYENHQIIRLDGKNKFVESLSRGFDIGKVMFNFVEYDDKRKAGDRIVQNVTVYMDFAKFRVFAQDMLSGLLARKAAENKGKVFEDLTGTPADKLKQHGRERQDGKAESRKIYLGPSSKGFFFTAESGPGERSETGLIKPAGKAEKKVSIPIDAEQAKSLVLMTLASMNAYESGKESAKHVEAMLKARNIIQ